MESNTTMEEENLIENEMETCKVKLTNDIVSLMETLQKIDNFESGLSKIQSELNDENKSLEKIVDRNNEIVERHLSIALDPDCVNMGRPNEDASMKFKKYYSPIKSEIALAKWEKGLKLAKNKKKYIAYLRTLHPKKPTHSQFKKFFTKILSPTCICSHNVNRSKYKKKLTNYVEWTECILQAYDITIKYFESFLKVNLPEMKREFEQQ